MPTLKQILAMIPLAGSALPAFKSLFDAVVATFGEDDQAVLKAAYADHIAKSDALHEDVKDALT